MADKPDKAEKHDAKPEEGGEGAPAKKKGGGLPIAVVAGLMLVEAAAVYFIVGATGPKAAEAEPVEIHGEPHADTEASVEIALVEDKFQNMQTGRVWIWDTEIVLKVKAKHEELVCAELESRAAEIQEGISTIFRKAQHASLKEHGLETINRQVEAFMNHIFGKDAEGHSRIQRVMIPKCKGFPAE